MRIGFGHGHTEHEALPALSPDQAWPREMRKPAERACSAPGARSAKRRLPIAARANDPKARWWWIGGDRRYGRSSISLLPRGPAPAPGSGALLDDCETRPSVRCEPEPGECLEWPAGAQGRLEPAPGLGTPAPSSKTLAVAESLLCPIRLAGFWPPSRRPTRRRHYLGLKCAPTPPSLPPSLLQCVPAVQQQRRLAIKQTRPPLARPAHHRPVAHVAQSARRLVDDACRPLSLPASPLPPHQLRWRWPPCRRPNSRPSPDIIILRLCTASATPLPFLSPDAPLLPAPP